MVLDGRILNPMLIGDGPTNKEQPRIISAIAYQTGTDQVYAATHQGSYGIVQKYNLIGTPRKVSTLDEEVFRWQENVALSVDEQGHVYILVDEPEQIIELDQEDQIVNRYVFQDMAGYANYLDFFRWNLGGIGRPLAMTVTPDGSMMFIVNQNPGQISLAAFALK
jgi:hypothetical protein